MVKIRLILQDFGKIKKKKISQNCPARKTDFKKIFVALPGNGNGGIPIPGNRGKLGGIIGGIPMGGPPPPPTGGPPPPIGGL